MRVKLASLLNSHFVRRLIINADDFGLTPGVNRAIVECHERGIVTSATLIANAGAFADAVRWSQSTSQLSIGCHVVLVDGSPVLAGAQISSLLSGSNARFHEGISGLGVRALRGRLNPHEIEAEATAQIRRLCAAGIRVTHLDTHKHTHIFPQVLEAMIRAAKACGIRAMRNPFGPVGMMQVVHSPALWVRWLKVAALQGLAAKFRALIRSAGMVSPHGTVGIVSTGALDEWLFRFVIERLPEGTWELVCHPGYNDAELAKVRTRLRDSRERELRLLTSNSARDLLTHCGIELISYKELANVSQ
jgi:hopanoid biosynthesis associated protein HpnK